MSLITGKLNIKMKQVGYMRLIGMLSVLVHESVHIQGKP